MKLTDYTTHADAQRYYASARLWELFDGDREHLNLAHECIDRHAGEPDRVAVRVVRGDGNDEILTFQDIARVSSRFAHWLDRLGVAKGDRIAIMLEPSLPFYAAVFGAIKQGAVAVPLFTLFGPDGVRLRVDDCRPAHLVTNADKWSTTRSLQDTQVHLDSDVMAAISELPSTYHINSRANDMAAFQYTSGTTRDLPDAVKHTHRAVVVVTNAALYATGIRPGDRFFCPSSPAWGHGMWHGTFAPLAMGVETGTFAGRFSPERLLEALAQYQITNLSAAATHYRMMMNCGTGRAHDYNITKLSFTGEPIDTETARYTQELFGVPVCSMYGTTEIGVILAGYPGASDFEFKAGSLGRPVPGVDVGVLGPDGTPCPVDEIGEIMVRRRDGWVSTRDRGWVDSDGYFFHAGRADDVIISAAYTIGAIEVEDTLLKHADVIEAAVIGVPDALRGQVVKAFVVSGREEDRDFISELQEFVRERLSAHEYPRHIEFVDALPKTPAGKVNRKALRDRGAATPTAS